MAKIRAKEATQPKRRRVEFKFEDNGANKVFLAGDFNEWNQKSHPMKKSGEGVWKRSILVTPGRYEYKFFVDGNWEEDNFNHHRCANNFGTYNCILDVR